MVSGSLTDVWAFYRTLLLLSVYIADMNYSFKHVSNLSHSPSRAFIGAIPPPYLMLTSLKGSLNNTIPYLVEEGKILQCMGERFTGFPTFEHIPDWTSVLWISQAVARGRRFPAKESICIISRTAGMTASWLSQRKWPTPESKIEENIEISSYVFNRYLMVIGEHFMHNECVWNWDITTWITQSRISHATYNKDVFIPNIVLYRDKFHKGKICTHFVPKKILCLLWQKYT